MKKIDIFANHFTSMFVERIEVKYWNTVKNWKFSDSTNTKTPINLFFCYMTIGYGWFSYNLNVDILFG